MQFLYHVPVELDLSKAREVSEMVQKYGKYTVDSWKPVVGKFIFTRESGGVAAQFHQPSAIEPYSAEIVRATRHVALGKKSGLANIKIKLDELGLSMRPPTSTAPFSRRLSRSARPKSGWSRTTNSA